MLIYAAWYVPALLLTLSPSLALSLALPTASYSLPCTADPPHFADAFGCVSICGLAYF